jgi:CheY-like chemotaxis protein
VQGPRVDHSMTGRAPSTRVLLVDDDEDLADTFTVWLEQEGYDVRTAYGGAAALERLDQSVDILLLDRRMPEVTGDEVLRAARDRPGDYQISMLTAVAPAADILDLPFDEYLTKPVPRQELLGAVERLETRASLDTELQELFRLTSKLSALETGTGREIEQARAELEAQVAEKQAAVDETLGQLDDHEEAFAVVDDG